MEPVGGRSLMVRLSRETSLTNHVSRIQGRLSRGAIRGKHFDIDLRFAADPLLDERPGGSLSSISS
jgi:hypothetical protein